MAPFEADDLVVKGWGIVDRYTGNVLDDRDAAIGSQLSGLSPGAGRGSNRGVRATVKAFKEISTRIRNRVAGHALEVQSTAQGRHGNGREVSSMVARTGSTDHRHGGFSPQLEGQEARRQFHISLSLVVMLSIGIVSAGVAVGGHPLSAKRDIVASRAPVTVMHAETNAVGARPI